MAYPNLQYPIDLNSGLYNDYQDAGSGWCGQRKDAKGNWRARALLKEWGLAKDTGSQTCFDAGCAFWNRNREYCITSNVIDAQEARRLATEFADGDKLAGCEIIEYLWAESEAQYKRVTGELDNASGARKDNLEIAKAKWGVVKDFIRGFRLFQGGTYEDGEEMDSCPEEAIGYIYSNAGDAFQRKIDEEGAPIPDSLLLGIIGAGTVLLAVVIYRITK